MKVSEKFILVGLILLLILLHRNLFKVKGVEGFVDLKQDYTKLVTRLSKDLGPYTKTASFVRDQLKTMISATGGSVDDASLDKVYKAIYSCTDTMVSSRQTCKSLGPNTSMEYASPDIYLRLPAYSENDSSATLALMKITDNLAERITREAEWFSTIIEKVQESLALGANPPAESPVGTVSRIDGFTGTCSADAARIQLAQKEAKTCTIPKLNEEIARINRLLDSPALKKALSLMNGILTAMLKLQSDLEKAKNGTLYPWQKDGPKKSYKQFQGGDRSAAFIFSMQQNQ
jgi:hypothetical protein